MSHATKRRTTARGIAHIIGAIAAVLCAVAPPAAAETLYKFVGGGHIGSLTHYDALLALTISDGVVTGQLRPLLGDSSAPIEVRGTNPKDGTIDLTINYPSGPKKMNFIKKVTGQRIIWQDTESNLWEFYRDLDSPLSDATMTLSEFECGSAYRNLEAKFKPGITSDRLAAVLAGNAQAAAMPVSYAVEDKKTKLLTGKKTIALGELLKRKRTADDLDVGFEFDTAVGTEAYLVKWLRGSGLFVSADLNSGGCDGADRSFFTVDRTLLFDDSGLSRPKFEQYIADRLPGFLSRDDKGKTWQFRLGQPRVTTVNIPPNPPVYRIRAYAASEVTRGDAGWWDAFLITFEPAEIIRNKITEYAIVVTVERLKTSRRSSGNTSPPDDAYFTKELTASDEAEVTTAIAKYFTRRDGGRCTVSLVADTAEKHRTVCDGR